MELKANVKEVPIESFGVIKRESISLEEALQSYDEDVETRFLAGSSNTDPNLLVNYLNNNLKSASHVNLEKVVLLNPALPKNVTVNHFIAAMNNIIFTLKNKLDSMSNDEFQEFIDDFLNEDKEDFENGSPLLNYLIDSNYEVDELLWDPESQVAEFLRSIYVTHKYLGEEKRRILEENIPKAYFYVQRLINENLALPFLFWTIPDDNTHVFSRENFNTNCDSLDDDSYVWNEEWGIPSLYVPPLEINDSLENSPPNFVFNIESGQFTLTTNLTDLENNESKVFSLSAGIGDGLYPVLPIYDNLGELQCLTAFFTHILWVNHVVERFSSPRTMFLHRIPIKLGYLVSDGEFCFSDDSVYVIGTDERVVKYTGLPRDNYLVVAFIESDYRYDGESHRVYEVAVMRDRMKRNYEVLFEIFPELERQSGEITVGRD